MRQRRWLELLKDYDCEILYHPGKANVVADALSRKEDHAPIKVQAMKIVVSSSVIGQIKEAQEEALKEENIRKSRIKGQVHKLATDSRGLKTRWGRVWIPPNCAFKEKLLDEGHKSRYSIHPGATKMYRDLKTNYWWPGMKRDVARYIEMCSTCAQVKAEHQKPYGFLQPIDIPAWKWEMNAPASPWMARKIIKRLPVWASPEPKDARVKAVSPVKNIILRPKKSASRPPSNKKPPNVSA
jgi:hypothetical protein